MPRRPSFISCIMTACVAVALVLGAGPVALASPAATSAETAGQAPARDTSPLVVDAVGTAAGSRRASYAWRGRSISYYESIPSKWDWSLATAIRKWNGAGGGIRFVRTTNRRAARLTIAYGATGAAAGVATVGRTRRAFVRLSPRYRTVDAFDAFSRIQVMGVFTHELGHVLGFRHTTARCSLMSPLLDVSGCGMLSTSMTPSLPGHYRCRTIDVALGARFVRVYGGRVRTPGTWCPIDPLPSAPGRIVFSSEPGTPVTVRWTRPTYAPDGSQMVIRTWQADVCDSPPGFASTAYVAVSDGTWQGGSADPAAIDDAAAIEDAATPGATAGETVVAAPRATCVSVQLVNRYGAGRAPVVGAVVGAVTSAVMGVVAGP